MTGRSNKKEEEASRMRKAEKQRGRGRRSKINQ